MTVKIAEWMSEPLVPVTVALKTPTGPTAVHDRITVAEPKGRLTVILFPNGVFAEFPERNWHAIAVDEDARTRLTFP